MSEIPTEFVEDNPTPHDSGLTFYRCMLCAGVVSVWDIRKGGCQTCGGTRIRPSNLTWTEKLMTMIRHPKVWKWKEEMQPANMVDTETVQ